VTIYVAAIHLYVFGLVGLHAVARVLNEGPIKTRRAWVGLILWPVTVPFAKLADCYEWLYEAPSK
jgi:hypothetical protein